MAETPLPERVERGIRWLTEHDPTGSFHLWFVAGLTPGSSMPAQSAERLEEYRAYYRARIQWEQLFAKLQREEATA